MLFTTLLQLSETQLQEEITRYCADHGLDQTILDQPVAQDLTLGTFVSELTEQLINRAAEEDRIRFRERQRNGIRQARENGVTIGRPTRKRNRQYIKIRDMYRRREVTGQEASRLLGIAPSTFYRWLRQEASEDE
ncbi:MAG: recombinase family protein [Butyricicoccus sp.]|nr:recombinase family protein [Butyricicoccus sp.]